MTPFLAGGLSAGLSLVSGLFGRNDAKKQQQKNEAAVAQANRTNEALGAKIVQTGYDFINAPMVKLGELVSSAEAAGFNPLTILRAGGLSAYSKNVDLGGYQLIESGYARQSPQVFQGSVIPSVGSVVAGALSSGFDAFSAESRFQQQHAFNKELLGMSLSARKVPTTKVASGSPRSIGLTPLSAASVNLADMPAGWRVPMEDKVAGQPHIFVMGKRFDLDPRTSNADEINKALGDDNPGAFAITGIAAMAHIKHHLVSNTKVTQKPVSSWWDYVPKIGWWQ